ETRQDGSQENRCPDPSIGVVVCGAVPRAQNRHIGARTQPEESLHEARSWQRNRRKRTHVSGDLWTHLSRRAKKRRRCRPPRLARAPEPCTTLQATWMLGVLTDHRKGGGVAKVGSPGE